MQLQFKMVLDIIYHVTYRSLLYPAIELSIPNTALKSLALGSLLMGKIRRFTRSVALYCS